MSISEAPIQIRPALPRTSAPPWRVRVLDSVEAALPAWRALARVAPHSVYQTPEWLGPWIDTVGRDQGITPAFVVIESSLGDPVAFLPLGVRRHRGTATASFLGGRDSNSAVALFRPGVSWSGAELMALLREAAHAMRPRPALLILAGCPDFWDDQANPLRLLGGEPGASFLHRADLGTDAETYFRDTLSNDTRKKLRTKRRKLEAMGPVTHVVAQDVDSAAPLLDAFFVQKLARFDHKGISSGFEKPAFRAFMERAIAESGLQLHALQVGSRVVATCAGGTQGARFQAMVSSFDSDPEIARSSPGDLLIMAMIERLVGAGVTVMDFGLGEARYKDTWCRRIEPVFDLALPVTTPGIVMARAERLRRDVKRAIKSNKAVFELLLKLRAALKGRRR